MLYLINMTSFANQFPILFGLFIFLFGLCIGSVLNVVIYRLPLILYRDNGIDGESKNSDGAEDTKVFNLAFPRSFCPACRNSLRWTENIPVFSYIFLKGRCRGCSVSIGLKYPLIELLTGLATLFLILYFGCTFKFLTSCILIYALIVLCFIDLDHFLPMPISCSYSRYSEKLKCCVLTATSENTIQLSSVKCNIVQYYTGWQR